ncbi:MAG: GlmU family protein [Bacteroidetes bacterium]|nr:GlmU family protein [Bacteroidota bacterium]
MNYILFEERNVRTNLLPLTFMRPVGDIRIGILTIREKWEKRLEAKTSTLTEAYLSKKFPILKEDSNVLINGAVCPTDEIIDLVKKLHPNQTIVSGDTIVAFHVTAEELDNPVDPSSEGIEEIQVTENPVMISHSWDIYNKNDIAIKDDFEFLTKDRKSQPLSKTNVVLGDHPVFLEKGAKVECAVLNTTNGPIYIGEDAEVMEGSMLRGPIAVCAHAQIKMLAKIYGPTTIGPYSRVGGEVNNSVIFSYSNKAHDGFLGHSVIAELCNLGADTNTSNLKNTYDCVRLWSYNQQTFINTHLLFCGLIMGDHSKCAINTMFNTGTVVGVHANIFGPGFQRNFIPSFTWGPGHSDYKLDKGLEVAAAVFKRRGLEFNETERELLSEVYRLTLKNKRL